MGMSFEKIDEGRYCLNVNGYVCPHPQIYTKKALEKLASGEILELIFDNPSSGESIEQMVENDGNELLEQTKESGQFIWHIQKALFRGALWLTRPLDGSSPGLIESTTRAI